MAISGPASLRRRKEHRLVYEMISESDLTIEVLDARFPHRCRSLDLEKFIQEKNKPLLLCINKSDLIPAEVADKWKLLLNRDYPTVHISTRDRNGTSMLRRAVFKLSPFRPSLEHPLTLCIVGYPNVGKSSLINVLAGRRSAPVSLRAGFTRTIRKVKITPKLFLIDTPGIAPTDSLTAAEKIYVGAVSPEDVLDPDLVVDYLFQQAHIYKQTDSWENYLKITLNHSSEEILLFFAHSRGLLAKGKEPQIEEAARIIIRDFLRGKVPYYEHPY